MDQNHAATSNTVKSVYSTMEAPPPLPPFLARSLSALARNGSGSSSLLLPSFYSCQICLSSYEASKTNPDEPFKPFKLENCGHIFCEDCMQQYVVSKVEDGQVNLTCFFLHNEDDSLNTTSPTSTGEEANLPPAPPTSSSSWTLGLFNALLGLPPSNPSSRSGGSRPAGSAPASCSTSLSELDIRRLLIPAQSSSSSSSAMRASNAFAKYERFKYDKSHPTARRCPACDASNLNVSVPVPVQGVTLDALNDKKKGIQPDMICEKCRANFCFYHSNSHPDMSCKEYLSSLPAPGSGDAGSPSDTGDDLFSSPGGVFSLPDGVVKQCPSCSALCQKSGGCNQMKCANCGQNFCWLCCQVVDGGTFPDHFQFWNLSGCPNMQMSESANSASSSAARLSRLFAFLQILIVGPPSFLLSVVALCLCWPCASAADPPDVRTEKSTARKFRSRVLNCSSF